jgi:lysozyme
MNVCMKTSAAGRALIMEREGCVLRPYQDSEGNWTDGVGNTHGVVPGGPPISQEKADADLERNLAGVEAAIMEAVTVDLDQYQFDALASFAFNVGEHALATSTLVRLLNEGRPLDEVAAQFDRWHIPAGIISRRNGEREQFKGAAFEARIA